MTEAAAAVRMQPVRGLQRFIGDLRGAGLPVGLHRETAFFQAVGLLGVESLDVLHRAGRLTLVAHPNHLPKYDELFWARFGSEPAGMAVAGPKFDIMGDPPATARGAALPRLFHEQKKKDQAPDVDVARALASSVEVLGDRDFATLAAADWDDVAALIHALRVDFPERRTHRRIPRRRGRQLDLRRTLRDATRTGGELVHRRWRDRRRRPRRVVFLLDVSASMEDYARALLIFAHTLSVRHAAVEVFCFSTRLTRLTDLARVRDPQRALREVAQRARDWRSGTRIGSSVAAFNRRFGRPGMARGAVIVVCSDGLECEPPETLATEMARLHRLAHRVVWVNPLKRDPRYAPIARGMAAAMPSVDLLLSGHNLRSLESLAELLPHLVR